MKKQKQTKLRKPRAKAKKGKTTFLTLGNINPNHGRILMLTILIIFVSTYIMLSMMRTFEEASGKNMNPVREVKVATPLQAEITKMVEGYPIEKMTPYILQQDPKTAMFLVAIAKKESAWGKRKPVLNGRDCYNYWGFRLKAEKMGSGGHTCFDSPKEAVETVAERIDQLVKEEEIDTPNDMIVWKCGYGCQDKTKTLSEKKWINDVDFYYSAMNEYL